MSESPDYVAPGGARRKVDDPEALPRIDERFVHKVQRRNVVLARVDRVPDAEHTFEAEITPDWDHPFFFEHPLDHVPAMMMVESGRQLGIAMGHMHYDVPLGSVFITQTFSQAFTDFADTETAQPVVIRAVASELVYEWTGPPLRADGPPHRLFGETCDEPGYVRSRLTHLRLEAMYRQDDRDLGGMSGSTKIYDRQAYVALRTRHVQRIRRLKARKP